MYKYNRFFDFVKGGFEKKRIFFCRPGRNVNVNGENGENGKRRTRQTWLGTSESGFPRKAPKGRWNPARGEAPGIDSNT